MTPEQITKWAREALLTCRDGSCAYVDGTDIRPALQAFASLIRNATLEEAAKLCDGMQPIPASEPRHCAQDIRSMKS
jgi:hypothetical protein